jgi:hypothetical protein
MVSHIGLMAIAAMATVVKAAGTGTTTGGNTTAAAVSTAPKGATDAAILNQDFYNYIFIVLASLIAALTLWRVLIEATKYIRTTTCLNNDRQGYFAIPSTKFASLKTHLLYAPVLKTRHNREFQLSSAINVGTLPTRFQLLFLGLYLGSNIAFCVVSINWSGSLTNVCKEVRNRTGILAVVNMVSGACDFWSVIGGSASNCISGSTLHHGST